MDLTIRKEKKEKKGRKRKRKKIQEQLSLKKCGILRYSYILLKDWNMKTGKTRERRGELIGTRRKKIKRKRKVLKRISFYS